jgi:hypothetical protein
MVDSVEKKCFQVYHFSTWLSQPGVLNKDPTVWLDGDTPPPSYVSKCIKIKTAEWFINAV